MSTKRRAPESSDEEQEVPEKRAKRQRARNDPHTGFDNAKYEAIHRLFGKYCNNDLESEDSAAGEGEAVNLESPFLIDEVPGYLDPEQIGFLVCAQETLRFLRRAGMTQNNPVYNSLCRRFLRAMKELEIA